MSPESPLDFEPPASETVSYLMPLLVVPLLKVNGSWGEGLDGTAFFIQQLDVDLIFTAAVPAWCVPGDKCLQSSQAIYAHSCLTQMYLPVRHFDVWLEVVHEGWAVAFFS